MFIAPQTVASAICRTSQRIFRKNRHDILSNSVAINARTARDIGVNLVGM